MRGKAKQVFFVATAGFLLFAFGSPLVTHAESQPKAHWKFDETIAGSDAQDSAGENDATPTNDPVPSATTPPAIDFENTRSIQLDGSQYFTLDRPVENDFSICSWIKTSVVGLGTAHWQTAAILEAEVGGLGNDFGFGIDSNGKLSYGNGGTSDITFSSSASVNDNEWHHVCVTRSVSAGEDSDASPAILYIDGEEDGTDETSTNTLDGNGTAVIGSGTDGATEFVGLIDDMRIYDFVLSPFQIAALASGEDYPTAESDVDNDGVLDSIEDDGPNSGDTNDDGTLDSFQANVVTWVSSLSDEYVTLAVDEECAISTATILRESNNALSDQDYRYPEGFMNFTLECGTPGYTATITQLYHFANFPSFELRKYNTSDDQYSTVADAAIQQTAIGDSWDYVQVIYEVTDGEDLDQDATENGVIVDPAGLGVSTQTLADTGTNTLLISSLALVLVTAGAFLATKSRGTY